MIPFSFIKVGTLATLFTADFTALSAGPMSAASFLSATGLTSVRNSVSTVQTSASAFNSTGAVNDACIGRRDAGELGLVIEHNVQNLFGSVSGDTGPRNLSGGGWTNGTATITSNYAAGPDGVGTPATRVNASSGQYSPYSNVTTSSKRCFSSWLRTVSGSTTQQHVWNQGSTDSGLVSALAGSTTWARSVISKGGNLSRLACAVCDCRGYPSRGGNASTARDIVVDGVQLQAGEFPTEVILTGLTRRRGERISYASGSSLVSGGRIKLHMRMAPKFASNHDVIYDGASAQGTAAYWYLWSFGAAGNDYARINASTRKLEVSIGGASATSTNKLGWAAYDDLEIYMEVGANTASVAMYRIGSSGGWTDLVLGTLTNSASPSGAFGLLHNDVAASLDGDSGQFPCWLKTITLYGTGSTNVSNVTPLDSASYNSDGLWRASYAGAPWTGTASTGASSGRSLTAGAAPATGTAVNSLTPGDFNGSSHWLEYAGAWTNFALTTGWTISAVFMADAAGLPGAQYYSPASIVSDTGGGAGIGVGFSTSGVSAWHGDGSGYPGVYVACTTAAWHIVHARYNGQIIEVSVDGGPWGVVDAFNATILTGNPRIGAQYNLGAYFDGKILEVSLRKAARTDSECNALTMAARARYALTL